MNEGCLEWRGDAIEIIDQTALPERFQIRCLHSVGEVVEAIRGLAIRGAPAIGVCGAFGMVLGLDERRPASVNEARAELDRLAEEIGSSRPTAANLRAAVQRVVRAASGGGSVEEIRRLAEAEALRFRQEDRESCRRISEFGRAELSWARSLLTHCNTGRLATAGAGTALGVVYAKYAAGEPVEVFVLETRPLLQGARLTAWELQQAGIPTTLLADSAAGAAMAAGLIDAVIVGCDRVAMNGDTANKIGTFTLAVVARAQGIPFYVAGPMTSFDAATKTGEGIVVEHRPGEELRRMGVTTIAPEVKVWNPAFDVTPGALITGFVTDRAVLKPPYDSIGREIGGGDVGRLPPSPCDAPLSETATMV